MVEPRAPQRRGVRRLQPSDAQRDRDPGTTTLAAAALAVAAAAMASGAPRAAIYTTATARPTIAATALTTSSVTVATVPSWGGGIRSFLAGVRVKAIEFSERSDHFLPVTVLAWIVSTTTSHQVETTGQQSSLSVGAFGRGRGSSG